jgi:putative membrane protein
MSEASQPEDYLPSYETEAARRAWRRRTSLEMIISGSIGLFTSFVLSIEAWQLAADSSARFGCDISSVLSCSTVAQTWQARILGFPNAFLGIFFEAVVLAISVGIFAGVKFPRWYMLGTNLLYTIALFFAFWLFGQSYFIIQVLCPWCLLITLTTTLVFGGITRINIRDRVIPAPEGLRRIVAQGLDWALWGLIVFGVLAMVVAKYGLKLLG